MHSLLAQPSFRNMPVDHLWAILDGAESLRFVLQPYRYLDGYHMLSLLYDIRLDNAEQATLECSERLIDRLFEIVFIRLEGLIAQLGYCIRAGGHADLADGLAPYSFDLNAKPPRSTDLLSLALRIERQPGKTEYEVFTSGFPKKEGGRLLYDRLGETVGYELVQRSAAE